MAKYVYNVKLTGIQDKPMMGSQYEVVFDEQTFAGLEAVERFISWWFNDIDVLDTFGFDAQSLYQYFGKDNRVIFVQTWCGWNESGLESFPAEKIRQACPALKNFYGFHIEVMQIEVLPSTWKPKYSHWDFLSKTTGVQL